MCPGSSSFPRRARLTGPADYQQVFNNCRFRVAGRWLTLLAVPNTVGHARLGLAISRKVARTAVARNRIKRLLRESFRTRRDSLGALDIVVLGRNDIAGQPARRLSTALDKLWTELDKKCAGPSSN